MTAPDPNVTPNVENIVGAIVSMIFIGLVIFELVRLALP